MTTQLLFLPTIAFASGVFAPGAKARFFLSGTSTPVTVFTDTDFLVPAASPLVADAAGRFAQIFYNGTSEIRCVITAADDTAIADIDPVGRSNSTGSAADDLSFSPITGNPATNVQAAIAANTATGIANAADIATNAAAILTRAPLASPALTGTPTAPTAAAATDTTQVATTAFVRDAVPDVLNAAGAAPVYAARAWVNFNGATTTPTILASGNVASVTRNGVGDYTINFTTAMPDANYAMSWSTSSISTGDTGGTIVTIKGNAGVPVLKTASAVTILVGEDANARDREDVSVIFFR